MMFVSGVTNTFPIFFPPLLREFGGTRAATAFTVSLVWLVGGALGPVAGHLVDRWSPRALVALGLGVAALGLAGAALAPSLTVFTLCLGIGGGIGVGLTGMVTQAAVIADEYVRRRGFATGIAFGGSMAGYLLATPAEWTISAFGWRAAFWGYVVVVLAIVPGVLRCYPTRLAPRVFAGTETVPSARSIRQVLASVPFAALAVVFTIAPMVGYLMTVQHTLYFASLGFATREAALMLAAGGALSAVGRAIAGLATDRFGGVITGFISYAFSLSGALCLLGLEFWPARALAYGYIAGVFFPLGSRATIVSVLVTRIAPPTLYGTVFGYLALVNNVGAAAGPFLSGALYDLTHSYLVIYVTAVAMIVGAIAALAVFVLTTRTRPA